MKFNLPVGKFPARHDIYPVYGFTGSLRKRSSILVSRVHDNKPAIIMVKRIETSRFDKSKKKTGNIWCNRWTGELGKT